MCRSHSLLFLYPLAIGLTRGGLGAAPPGIRAGGVVASPRRNMPLKKRPGKARPFSFHGPRSGFLGVKLAKIQRAGVFRPSGGVLRVKNGDCRDAFCVGTEFAFLTFIIEVQMQDEKSPQTYG